jgi:hypothetical protein
MEPVARAPLSGDLTLNHDIMTEVKALIYYYHGWSLLDSHHCNWHNDGGCSSIQSENINRGLHYINYLRRGRFNTFLLK